MDIPILLASSSQRCMVPGYCIFQTVASIMLFPDSFPFHSKVLFILSASPVWPTFWFPTERIYTFHFLSRFLVFFHVSDVWIRHIVLTTGILIFLFKYCTVWRGSSIGIVTTLWNEYLNVRGSLPDSQKGFLSLVHHIHTGSWAPKVSPLKLNQGFFPWG